jgi:PilZ domain
VVPLSAVRWFGLRERVVDHPSHRLLDVAAERRFQVMSERVRGPVKRRLADRRGKPRYDVVGELWGTLELVVQLTLRNLSPSGALIESHVPLTPDSVHWLRFDGGGRQIVTQMQVRHVTPSPGRDGGTYFIGVEFLSPPSKLVEGNAPLMSATTAGADSTEA